MGISGNWLRVTPVELVRAKDDLDWALKLAKSARKNEEWRLAGTDKAWHALDFLLKRRGFTVPIVEGAEAFPDTPVPVLQSGDKTGDKTENEDELDDPGSDWGYGPPRYLTPEQVAEAAAELAKLTGDDLIRGVDPADLTRAQVYPSPWTRPDDLLWPSDYLPHVREFFTCAAKDGDAVICWFN